VNIANILADPAVAFLLGLGLGGFVCVTFMMRTLDQAEKEIEALEEDNEFLTEKLLSNKE
jgi:hypothetical protein